MLGGMSGPPTPLEYGRPPARSATHVRRWIAYPALVIVVAFLLTGLMIPSSNHSRERAVRAICASNLHQVGLAIHVYRQDHGGRYPDTLGTLIREVPGLASRTLVCPDSTDTPAAGPTTRDVADAVAAGGHCSYVYAGAGRTDGTAGPSTVVAYEPMADHKGDGCNVLFGDGDVRWLDRTAAATALPAGTVPAGSGSQNR